MKLSETRVRLKYGVKCSDFYLWCRSELLVVSQSKTLQKPILISWLEKHKWLVCITGVGGKYCALSPRMTSQIACGELVTNLMHYLIKAAGKDRLLARHDSRSV